MQIIYRIILFQILCGSVLAANPQGIGLVAGNMMAPVVVLSGFVSSACIIIGGTCLFASFLKYLQHRVNPLAVPISTVLVLFILGAVLVVLPLAYKVTESGIPFHLM